MIGVELVTGLSRRQITGNHCCCISQIKQYLPTIKPKYSLHMVNIYFSSTQRFLRAVDSRMMNCPSNLCVTCFETFVYPYSSVEIQQRPLSLNVVIQHSTTHKFYCLNPCYTLYQKLVGIPSKTLYFFTNVKSSFHHPP
jgi:hypothetical protein